MNNVVCSINTSCFVLCISSTNLFYLCCTVFQLEEEDIGGTIDLMEDNAALNEVMAEFLQVQQTIHSQFTHN